MNKYLHFLLLFQLYNYHYLDCSELHKNYPITNLTRTKKNILQEQIDLIENKIKNNSKRLEFLGTIPLSTEYEQTVRPQIKKLQQSLCIEQSRLYEDLHKIKNLELYAT